MFAFTFSTMASSRPCIFEGSATAAEAAARSETKAEKIMVLSRSTLWYVPVVKGGTAEKGREGKGMD